MTDPWLVQFEARLRERSENQRSFELLGETLTVKATVSPEIVFAWGDLSERFGDYVRSVQEAEAEGEPLPTNSGIQNSEMLDTSEATIRACLAPNSLPAWERLRDPARAEPLGLFDIYGIAGFVITKTTELPTEGPVDSSTGPQTNGASSKAESSSRAAGRKR